MDAGAFDGWLAFENLEDFAGGVHRFAP